MTTFLHQLAGMALGNPRADAARVSLPPRFAPSPDAASARRDEATPDDQEPATRFYPVAPPPQETSPQNGDRALVPVSGAAVARPARPEAPPPRANQSRPPTVAAAATPTPRASGAKGSSRPERPARDRHSPRHGLESPTSAALSPQPSARQTRQPAVLPPPAAPREARVTPSPLSDVAVASRMRASRDEGGGPVIHVTIDRIDVRAPAAATPRTAKRREHAEPSVSLAEYLRGAEPAGRA